MSLPCKPLRMIHPQGKCIQRHRMDVYIASAGGTGSNFLYNYLCSQGLAVGSTATDYGARWCHSLDPLIPDIATGHTVRRSIFLYSANPILQVESIYRQGYADVNYKKKLGLPSSSHVKIPKNINEYCKGNEDVIHLEDQWNAWVQTSIQSKVSFPILTIQFEALWNHVDDLFKYLGLPLKGVSQFPKKKDRSSRGGNWSGRCRNMYQSLERKIATTPEVLFIWDGHNYTSFESFQSAYSRPAFFSVPQECNQSVDWSGSPQFYRFHIKR